VSRRAGTRDGAVHVGVSATGFAFASFPTVRQAGGMPRWILLPLALLSLLGGCSRPDLPDMVVRAESDKELAEFRTDLARRFPADRLTTFDTALQELVLDALNRGVAPASARDADMRAVVHGRTVREARILGWEARRQRLLAEVKLLTGMRDEAAKHHEKSPSTSLAARISSAEEVLARLHGDLKEADQHLAAWRTPAKP
jgi:hypothetical protein